MNIENEIKRVFCQCDDPKDLMVQLRVAPQETLHRLLFQMIMFNSLPLLKLMVEFGVDVNTPQGRGVSPLLYACQEGQVEMADYLLKAGALLLGRCDRGFSALTYAVISRSLPMVKWACERGCDPNHRDGNGLSVLHAAVAFPSQTLEEGEEQHICSIIEYLIQQGAIVSNDHPSPYQLAIGGGLLEAAKVLEKQSPKPSLLTARITLAFSEEILSQLDLGADINELDEEGGTPLAHTIMRGVIENASLLIDRGADIHVVDKMGWTLLHYLGLFGKGQSAANLAERLIGMGLDVNAKCKNGNTPLSMAKGFVHPEVAEILKKHAGVET